MEKIDFSNIEAFTPIMADGYYVLKISGYETGTSEMKGTPYIRFKCVTESNESINVTFYMSEKALWRFKKFIMALGHPGTGTVNPLQIANQCIGRSLKIVCNHPETIDPVTNQKVAGKYLEVKDFMAC